MTNASDMDRALQNLIDGNKRYTTSKLLHPNQTAERRAEVSKGQKPFAVIVGCSDSRIPPEIIFDQGLGDLFVIRVAGNIIDEVALGSIEYAVDHLGTKLVVVLGHGKCGAVTAATQGGETHGHIGSILTAIAPALERAKGLAGDFVDNAIRANVDLVVAQIKAAAPILSEAMKAGNLKVLGAYYNIDTGTVEII